MPLDTAFTTNQFLYFRDIKENPLPQPDTTFSVPHDQMFFKKLNNHLNNYNAQNLTQESLQEALNQLNSHSKTPLATIEFFGSNVNFQSFSTFFNHPNNEAFRQQLAQILCNFTTNQGSLSALQNANSELLDDFLTFILQNFNDYPVLCGTFDVLTQDLNLIKDQKSIFYEKIVQYIKNFSAEKITNLGHILEASHRIGRMSIETLSESGKISREILELITKFDNKEVQLYCFQYLNDMISLEPKNGNFYAKNEILEIASNNLKKFSSELQVQCCLFIGRIVNLCPFVVVSYLSGDNLQKLIDGLKQCANSGYDQVRQACCQSCIFMIDGSMRKDRKVFQDILVILQEQGVRKEDLNEMNRMMQ